MTTSELRMDADALGGFVSPDALARRLKVSKAELEAALGVPQGSVCSRAEAKQRPTQRLLHDLAEIMRLAVPWTGSAGAALDWYRSQPLPSFGGQTAQALVLSNKGEAVKSYLQRVGVGGYA